MDYSVITFYKYQEINYPDELRDTLRLFCEELGLFGRILIGQEGINAGISGKKKNIDKFKSEISKVFTNLIFNEHKCEKNTYHKLIIRTRKEIVKFGKEVNINNVGDHINPVELKFMMDNHEDFILLDARSDYETNIGKFKDAKILPINKFRNFPDKVKDLNLDKSKKIITYCTGGVRCEKASAYLKENGFEDVGQLQGGIINYLEQFNDGNFEGNLFVFDDRLVAYNNKSVSFCDYCKSSSDNYINCHNMDCDKLFICCNSCKLENKNTCSTKCRIAPRQRPKIKNKDFLGIITNYFVKPGIAEVKTIGKISRGSKLLIEGRTTKEFKQNINELNHLTIE